MGNKHDCHWEVVSVDKRDIEVSLTITSIESELCKCYWNIALSECELGLFISLVGKSYRHYAAECSITIS